MKNGRPRACANIYKHGRLKTRKEMIEDGTTKKMTTEVTIKKTDAGNHDDVMIDVINGEGDIVDSHRLTDSGEEKSLYVYDTQTLVVREVEKE